MDMLNVHYYQRKEEEGNEAQKTWTQTWPARRGTGLDRKIGNLGRDSAKIGSLLGIL